MAETPVCPVHGDTMEIVLSGRRTSDWLCRVEGCEDEGETTMGKRTHLLKTEPRYWTALARGDKTFEVRKDDRGYAEGDLLICRFYDPADEHRWCGASPKDCIWEHHCHEREDLTFEVTYVLPGGRFGVDERYVVMGLAWQRQEVDE